MLSTAIVAARDAKRLHEISSVLIGYGLDDLMNRLGLSALRTWGQGARTDPDIRAMSHPERVRRAIEKLGATFIKLGQILATRSDLLPPDWIAELERLQSGANPLPWAQVESVLTEALGAHPRDIFAVFDETPVAAASMAQVHRARLDDGTEVAVKVLRPGLKAQVDADLRLLSHALSLAAREWPELARYRPQEIVGHLAAAMREETDLLSEGRTCETVAANLSAHDHVVIPRIHWHLSSSTVLVQDWIEGIAPTADNAERLRGLDGPLLAARGTEAFLHMALVDGLFHADPHPGNLLALPGNRVGFIDFGMVGRLSARRRDQLLAFVAALTAGRAEGIAGVLLDWSGGGEADIARIESAAQTYISRHGRPPLRLAAAVADFMTLARENGLMVPPDFALLFKALLTADGCMRRLDPDFDIIRVAGPFVRRAMRRRYAPDQLKDKAEAMALDLHGLAGELPSLARLLLHRLRQGQIGAKVEIDGLDRLISGIHGASRRIAVALVTAAFALGLAPRLMDIGPRLHDVPVFAIIGLLVIAAGLVWLMLPLRRS